jgi:tRNA U38,U39,U40 pseudouridine synthase TruA
VRERDLDVTRYGDMVHIHAHANAFAAMVRNIAGVLMTVGAGEHERRRNSAEARAARSNVTAAPDGFT